METVKRARRLAAVCPRGLQLGLHAGQKATDARALVPGLALAEAEPEAAAAALTALADWCVRFSPAVALDPPDGLFLDIAGVAHLWGDEAGMMADFRDRLAANGLPFRTAVADTPGAAWALVRFGGDAAIAPPGGQAPLLGPLPPAALRLDPEASAQIERLGLRRLDQLMALPRGPLARRFGQGTLDRLDQALGLSREALRFRRPPTPWFARLAFFEPISTPDDMARVAHDVLARLCARLEAGGQGARRFELAYHRLDGVALPVDVGLSRAGRDPARIAKLVAPKLEAIDPGFGIEVITAEAHDVEALSGRQGDIADRGRPATEEGVAALVDRLVNRLGEDRVWRARPVESHVPELAVERAAPLAQMIAGPRWDPASPRPVRLFQHPEALDHVMALTPDDPPSQFRWRGRIHRVQRAEGPERIAEEWWKRDFEDARVGHVRDYYRVEDQEGARFWLFRAGLYDPAQPARWWMHGLFG